MEIRNLKVSMEKDTAFGLMDLRKDNPLYEEMENLYEELEYELHNLIEPKMLLGISDGTDLFGDRRDEYGKEYACLLCTLGSKISNYIAGLFDAGEYLKGTLADAMADSCLFAAEEEWKKILRLECGKRKQGIAKRMEAPRDFPMEYQKRIWELLKGERMGVTLTSGFMFSPVKTCCFLFLLSKDCGEKHLDHDCSRCENVDCVLKKQQMTKSM